MQELMKWKRKKTTHKYTRIDDFSLQLFDAIYENEFELAKILIDDGKVDVNIKKDCGDTPLIATCQQTTLQNEEEAVKFIHYLWQRVVLSFTHPIIFERQPWIMQRVMA